MAPVHNAVQVCPKFFPALFRCLDEAGIRYCVLHGWQQLPQLESDLDIVVDPADEPRLALAFKTLQGQGFELMQCRNYAVRGYRFEFFSRHGGDVHLFSLDVIFEYRYAGLILQSAQDLLRGRTRQAGMWVAGRRAEFTYLLLKKTVKQGIRPGQVSRLRELASELGSTEVQAVAAELFGRKWAARVGDACRDARLAGLLPPLRTRLWQRKLTHKPFDLVRYAVQDSGRLLRRWLQPTGLQVIVLGPDGVGKNTVISQLAEHLEPAFRFQKMFHWRPGVLWRLKGMGKPVPEPHGKPVYGKLLSLVSLLACFLDHWIGYLLVIRPFLTRSGLVVFNRYFDDLLVDPVRYRYGGPRWLPRVLARFTPSRGALVVVLAASPEAILARKQELSWAEVKRQLAVYGELADRSNGRVVYTDGAMEEVGADAVQTVAQYLRQRSLRRYRGFAGPADCAWAGQDEYGRVS